MAASAKKVVSMFDKTQDAPRDSARPFRLWDVRLRRNMRWRYYSDAKRAHMAALCEARWMRVGQACEVYDARTGHMLGQYIRTPDSVRFIDGRK